MLEAAAAGARVIASRDAIPAVLYRVAEIFPTGDAPALSALLQSALDEPFDAARRERLRATARSYTWDRVAAATAEVYREALGEVHAG
jgi:glycosyltransferase involved in cell wall biosynthesis